MNADATSTSRSTIDDCWNRIGVRGDASCPKLDDYVHCRNCPVSRRQRRRACSIACEARTSIEQHERGVVERNAQRRPEATRFRASCFASAANGSALPTTDLRASRATAADAFAAASAASRGAGRRQRARRVARVRVARAAASVSKNASRKTRRSNQAARCARTRTSARHSARAGRDHRANGDHEGPIAFPVDAVDGVHRFATRRASARARDARAARCRRMRTRSLRCKDATVGLLDADASLRHA